MTLVSVVVPFFGRADWLRAAVESALAQTHREIEVIVIDDGSEPPPRIRGEVTDERVRYVRQRHAGVSAARNHGLRLSRGRYVAFLDADDLFLPDKLSIQVEAMEANPDVALSHTSYVRMDERGNDLEVVTSGTLTGLVYPAVALACPIATPTVVVRREAVQGLLFEESVRVGEDVILWVQLARRHRILGIDQPLTRVRMHGRNASTDPGAQFVGGVAILEHAFREDDRFSLVYRRRAMAQACVAAGYLYLDQGNRVGALRCAARGGAFWPLGGSNVKLMLTALMPRSMRRGLRRLREAMS